MKAILMNGMSANFKVALEQTLAMIDAKPVPFFGGCVPYYWEEHATVLWTRPRPRYEPEPEGDES